MEKKNNRMECNWVQKICYGMGHVYNDLCAAMWFSYTLFYLQIIIQIESKTAGLLIMTGQIVDSLATPAVGWAVDRTGSRKAWHLAGTFAVSVGFTLIYCLKPTNINTSHLIYYGLVISLFQMGWAIIQISHLSIIPEIATSHADTSNLTAIRYTASVCCNITVYIITFVILKNDQGPNEIGPGDFPKFKEVALIITIIGIFSSLIFYCGILKRQTNAYESIPDSNDLVTPNEVTHFLRSSIIYKVALMYMTSRLFGTLTLIYIPLYLDERQTNLQEAGDNIRHTIASVPLTCFISSFLASIFLKNRLKFCNDQIVYLSGILLAFITSIWINIGIPSNPIYVYIIAAIIGISTSATMVASLCLTAEFVKVNGYGSASVYSTVTFTDKIISGVVVLIVQYLQCIPKEVCPNYYENVLAYVCGAISTTGLVSLISLRCHK